MISRDAMKPDTVTVTVLWYGDKSMKQLYFLEYIGKGSHSPVDVTVGIQSKEQGIAYGRAHCTENKYRGFWISSKSAVAGETPVRLEYHGVRVMKKSGKVKYDPPVVSTDET